MVSSLKKEPQKSMITETVALENLRKLAEAFQGSWAQHCALQESLQVLEKALMEFLTERKTRAELS